MIHRIALFRGVKNKEKHSNAEIQIAEEYSDQPDNILIFPDRTEYHSLITCEGKKINSIKI